MNRNLRNVHSGSVLLSPTRQKVNGKRKTDKPVAPPPSAKKKGPPVETLTATLQKEKSGCKEVVIDSDRILLVPEWCQSNPLGGETASSVSTTRNVFQ